MAKLRQHYSTHDAALSPTGVRSREWEGPSRWTEYLGPDLSSPKASRLSRNKVGSDGQVQSSGGGSHKGLNLQWVVQLTEIVWKAGVFPNYPRICLLLSKKFPEHFSKLQLERVDKVALDALNDGAEVHLQSLEPWVQGLFQGQVLEHKMEGQCLELPLDKIRRPLMRTRANDPNKVKELMDSIKEIGLQVPIDVLEVDGVYYGFSGCHRYEAHQRLGLPTIRCKIRRGTKETLRFTFDLLSILYDLHQTLLISNLILPFPFYFAGITSAESCYFIYNGRNMISHIGAFGLLNDAAAFLAHDE
ncbi:hypothetical protein POTOM_043456 [Populus tomentosa]|uniref:ParB-like N-terminal domain-containing protein n=1 Tax=Populus tomentosa TaxID=118781 RepID=A0A8X7YIG2_POPTO|nr:hypothetical protein POTOM_043456 [Populus tomentosa]